MNTLEPHSNDSAPEVSLSGSLSLRICATLLILYALYYARSLFVPLVTGVVFYLILRPIVRKGRRHGIKPAVSATAVILLVIVALAAGAYLLVEPAKSMMADAPRYMTVVKGKLSFVLDRLEQVDNATEEITDSDEETDEELEEKPVPVEIKQPSWATNIAYLSGTGNIFSFITVSLVLLYFLLAAGDDLLRSIMRSLPNYTARRKLIETIENVQEGLGSYLAQVAAINAGLGCAVTIAMWLLGMPTPLLWGVMAFAFNFLPIVGAMAGATIIFLVALVNFEPTYYAFVVTATFIALTSLEGQFITPSILGRAMHISPVLVFLSIVIWGWMWGLMGVFLSIPILIAARMTCEGYEGLTPLALILGGEVPPHEETPGEESREEQTSEEQTLEEAPSEQLTERSAESGTWLIGAEKPS